MPIPASFPPGTEFADVNGVPVTFSPGDPLPFRWNVDPPKLFNPSLLVSDGVPMSEAEFRKKFCF